MKVKDRDREVKSRIYFCKFFSKSLYLLNKTSFSKVTSEYYCLLKNQKKCSYVYLTAVHCFLLRTHLYEDQWGLYLLTIWIGFSMIRISIRCHPTVNQNMYLYRIFSIIASYTSLAE